ncbi:MAG TPA: hypothetical protein VH087_03640 [Thermoanaerobaculia bacterium]|jgi:hypothetical protein|nr:hypothetical protein [Thermoanaerobaculia bacterium]
MKSSLFVLTLTLTTAAAMAGPRVDMKDPRRALAREDDIRIDAQLLQDTLRSNGPIAVTYQVENLSNAPVAIADRVAEVDFNPDDLTLTLTIGTEALTTKTLPHLVVVAPGEKKTFRSGGTVHGVLNGHGPFAVVPRTVLICVNVLRDVSAFREAIQTQQQPNAVVAVTNDMFDHWIDSNDAIALNALPVRWSSQPSGTGVTSADQPSPSIAEHDAGSLW